MTGKDAVIILLAMALIAVISFANGYRRGHREELDRASSLTLDGGQIEWRKP
jgi:cbb3-type cytochrome oxidase subunit 3